MSLSRRQFLILGGTTGGLGLSFLAHRLLAENLSARQTASPSKQRSSSLPQAEASPPASVPPHPDDPWTTSRGDVRIAVISDLNSQYGSTDYDPEVDAAIALIPDFHPDLVLCGGDMVAGQKTSLTTENIQAMWAAFDQHVAAPLRQAGIPFGFTIGNHDGSAVLSGGTMPYRRERDLAAAYWNNPQHDPGLKFVDRAGFPFRYTFEQNGVFFLVWDASTAEITSEQLSWVERSLGSAAAQSARLRLAIGHLPLYAVAVGRDAPGEYLNHAEDLRSRLERYRVHTYVSGHHHTYYPGHRGQLDLLHAGAVGGGPRQLLGSDRPPQKTLTVVDITLDAETTTYTTLDLQTMTLLDQRQLPRLITGPTTTIWRRDLQWADLTAEEQAIVSNPGSV